MIKWSIINNFRLSLVHVQDKNNIYIYRINTEIIKTCLVGFAYFWQCFLLLIIDF